MIRYDRVAASLLLLVALCYAVGPLGTALIVPVATAYALWVSDFWRQPVKLNRPARSLLYDRYASSKVPKDLDTIVIGAGMSGLSCAAVLARLGRKVLVLEQHDRAGGGTHTFDLDGYRFDSGLHYTVPWSTPIFQLTMGTNEGIPTMDLMGEPDGTFDKLYNGSDPIFKLKHGEAHKEDLYERFPDQRRGLDEYYRVSNMLLNAVKVFMASKLLPKWLQQIYWTLVPETMIAYMSMTAKDFLNKVITDPRLVSTLSGLWLDTGARPDKATFMLTAAVFRGLPLEGGCYPAGGSESMAAALVPVIERCGGRVLVRADVQELVFEGGRCRGVKLAGGEVIRAKNVVSSTGYHNTFQNLVPNDVSAAHKYPLELGVRDSPGFIMVNVGINATAEELDVTNTNVWYNPTDERGDLFPQLESYFENPLADGQEPPCFITFPSMKDKAWGEKNPGKVSCQMLLMGTYDWFEQHAQEHSGQRAEAYQQLKQRFQERALAQLYRFYPKIRGHVELVDVSTPLSIEHYLRASRGGAVGLDQSPERFTKWEYQQHLDPVTRIPGLYLTGQDTLICGVTLCQLAGVITAFRMGGALASLKIFSQAWYCT